MALFDGIQAASAPGKKYNYLGNGTYLIQIVRLFTKSDRNGIDTFIGKFRVVRVVNAPPADISQPHYVGQEVSSSVKAGDRFLPEVKAVIMAATGLSPEMITKPICDQAVSDQNPLAGTVIEYTGEPVPNNNWSEGKPRFFTNRYYNRMVPYSELNEKLSAEEKIQFFGEAFDWTLAIQAEAQPQAVPPQPVVPVQPVTPPQPVVPVQPVTPPQAQPVWDAASGQWVLPPF